MVGRLLRVAVEAWRGPSHAVRLDQLEQAVLGMSQRIEANGQPTEPTSGPAPELQRLLDVVTRLSSRQAEIDADRDHLAKSVPVALRRLTREQAASKADALEVTREVRGKVEALAGELADLRETVGPPGHWQEIEALRQRSDELASNVTYLLGRVEFVRSELLYEFRYQDGTVQVDHEPVEPVIKNDRSRSEGPIRVNLGCGHLPLEGYVNVDSRDLPGVDVVADVRNLPFDNGSVDEFFSAHFLEHFPEQQIVRVLLPYLRQKLSPNGRFRAVVPDVDAMMREYVAGRYEYDKLREVVYGSQDYDGDFHYNMYTPESLSRILSDTGFVAIDIVARGRVNGMSLEFEIGATRG